MYIIYHSQSFRYWSYTYTGGKTDWEFSTGLRSTMLPPPRPNVALWWSGILWPHLVQWNVTPKGCWDVRTDPNQWAEPGLQAWFVYMDMGSITVQNYTDGHGFYSDNAHMCCSPDMQSYVFTVVKVWDSWELAGLSVCIYSLYVLGL